MGDNLNVVLAEFQTLSKTVLLISRTSECFIYAVTYKVENSAQF
jgi:hypothetical protein